MSVRHAAVYVNPHAFSEDALQHAKAQIVSGGKLDVVVVHLPSSVPEADEIVRRLYAYAPPRPQELDYTVMFAPTPHEKEWEATFDTDASTGGGLTSVSQAAPATSESTFVGKYNVVAVGGTWDHIHWGHRLMMTLAAYTAAKTVVLGVTGTELLAKKKYAEALDSYADRTKAAVDFIKYLRPDLSVQPAQMLNMFGPTIEMEGIDALVVSKETSSGGKLVNEERSKLHWHPLDIIEVGLVPGGQDGAKLSSTDLRREDLAKKRSDTKI